MKELWFFKGETRIFMDMEDGLSYKEAPVTLIIRRMKPLSSPTMGMY